MATEKQRIDALCVIQCKYDRSEDSRESTEILSRAKFLFSDAMQREFDNGAFTNEMDADVVFALDAQEVIFLDDYMVISHVIDATYSIYDNLAFADEEIFEQIKQNFVDVFKREYANAGFTQDEPFSLESYKTDFMIKNNLIELLREHQAEAYRKAGMDIR